MLIYHKIFLVLGPFVCAAYRLYISFGRPTQLLFPSSVCSISYHAASLFNGPFRLRQNHSLLILVLTIIATVMINKISVFGFWFISPKM